MSSSATRSRLCLTRQTAHTRRNRKHQASRSRAAIRAPSRKTRTASASTLAAVARPSTPQPEVLEEIDHQVDDRLLVHLRLDPEALAVHWLPISFTPAVWPAPHRGASPRLCSNKECRGCTGWEATALIRRGDCIPLWSATPTELFLKLTPDRQADKCLDLRVNIERRRRRAQPQPHLPRHRAEWSPRYRRAAAHDAVHRRPSGSWH